MSIESLRYPDRKMVSRMVTSCQLEGAVIGHDDRGFYAHSFTMPDWLAAMPTDPNFVQGAPIAITEDKPKRAPVRNIKNGACDLIRAWARENPEATKADGVAKFPELNPATIAIQLRKVRLGLV